MMGRKTSEYKGYSEILPGKLGARIDHLIRCVPNFFRSEHKNPAIRHDFY